MGPPPPIQRNPLLIPGIAFAVVAVVLITARSIPPRKLNCGSVAMSLTTAGVTIELKRTSR